MKLVVVSEKQSIFEKYSELLQSKIEQDLKCEVICVFQNKKESRKFINELKALAPDVLLTVNLLGFEQCTLTDNISYNLLNCKQVHLLLHEKLANEKYLSKQLSIAMFFYCSGDVYYEHLKTTYPNLPYLKKIEGWQIGESDSNILLNIEVISGIVKEVAEECCVC